MLYNGVDLERFHPSRRATEGAALRAELGAGDAPVWLFVGSGFRRKGLDTALRALAGAARRRRALGRGQRRPEAVARASPMRSASARACAGSARDRDVAALYAAADALILPTRYDAFANVCLEAAAAGIPVVTSASNGAAEILGDGGIVVRDAEDDAGLRARARAAGGSARSGARAAPRRAPSPSATAGPQHVAGAARALRADRAR